MISRKSHTEAKVKCVKESAQDAKKNKRVAITFFITLQLHNVNAQRKIIV